jgi:hypothetical protein
MNKSTRKKTEILLINAVKKILNKISPEGFTKIEKSLKSDTKKLVKKFSKSIKSAKIKVAIPKKSGGKKPVKKKTRKRGIVK